MCTAFVRSTERPTGCWSVQAGRDAAPEQPATPTKELADAFLPRSAAALHRWKRNLRVQVSCRPCCWQPELAATHTMPVQGLPIAESCLSFTCNEKLPFAESGAVLPQPCM